MGCNKGYHGYKAFSYMTPGKDYTPIDLPEHGDQIFPQSLIPLNPEQEARVQELAKKTIMISLHDHPGLRPLRFGRDYQDYFKQGRSFIDYEALSHSYWDGMFDFMATSNPTSKKARKFTDIVYELGFRLCDIMHQEDVILCLKVDDIYRAHRENKIALAMGCEYGDWIENEVDRIEILYGLGLRAMGLSYNQSNMICTGGGEARDGGLTKFGREVVDKMNRTGMIIDLTHTSYQTRVDTIACSKKPVLISHTAALGICGKLRQLPDDLIKACADHGGLIGIIAAPHCSPSDQHPACSVWSAMDHFEYILKMVGPDYVTFGNDTIYCDHVAMHNTMGYPGDDYPYPRVDHVEGMENMTEASFNIMRYLVLKGYSDQVIQKVCGGNTLRIMRECWA